MTQGAWWKSKLLHADPKAVLTVLSRFKKSGEFERLRHELLLEFQKDVGSNRSHHRQARNDGSARNLMQHSRDE